MRSKYWLQQIFFNAALFVSLSAFAERELCVYQNTAGELKQVNSRSLVPEEFRAGAKCFDEKSSQKTYLAKPEDVTLKGNLREQSMVTSLGKVDIRWPRKVEALFGRSPERAVAEAMRVVSKVLKSHQFPYELKVLNREWKVVFLDEELPELQIPAALVTNCHPAWMTPPANLYVVGQRVVAGCGGAQRVSPKGVNDSELSKVLLHEIGHVVEFEILKGKGGGERLRAEGFACWFEQLASKSAPDQKNGDTEAFYAKLAEKSFEQSPDAFSFGGTAQDYARAATFFHAIVNRRGIGGLMDIYESISAGSGSFFTEVQRALGWDPSRLNAEARKVLDKTLERSGISARHG